MATTRKDLQTALSRLASIIGEPISAERAKAAYARASRRIAQIYVRLPDWTT